MDSAASSSLFQYLNTFIKNISRLLEKIYLFILNFESRYFRPYSLSLFHIELYKTRIGKSGFKSLSTILFKGAVLHFHTRAHAVPTFAS